MQLDDHCEGDDTFVAREGELAAGYSQEYVEDCRRCCRPNLIRIHIDHETHVITLGNELEYE